MIALPQVPSKPDAMTDRELIGAIVALKAIGGSSKTLKRLQAVSKRRFAERSQEEPK